jgi:hypothetical protein
MADSFECLVTMGMSEAHANAPFGDGQIAARNRRNPLLSAALTIPEDDRRPLINKIATPAALVIKREGR